MSLGGKREAKLCVRAHVNICVWNRERQVDRDTQRWELERNENKDSFLSLPSILQEQERRNSVFLHKLVTSLPRTWRKISNKSLRLFNIVSVFGNTSCTSWIQHWTKSFRETPIRLQPVEKNIRTHSTQPTRAWALQDATSDAWLIKKVFSTQVNLTQCQSLTEVHKLWCTVPLSSGPTSHSAKGSSPCPLVLFPWSSLAHQHLNIKTEKKATRGVGLLA